MGRGRANPGEGMDVENDRGQVGSLTTPAAMTRRVLIDAKRAFGDRVDEPVLERYAEAAVTDLWRDSIKVTSFVPVLALRHIREMLDQGERDGASPATSSLT